MIKEYEELRKTMIQNHNPKQTEGTTGIIHALGVFLVQGMVGWMQTTRSIRRRPEKEIEIEPGLETESNRKTYTHMWPSGGTQTAKQTQLRRKLSIILAALILSCVGSGVMQ